MPRPRYFRISSRSSSGVMYISRWPTFSSQIALMRLTRTFDAVVSAAELKSRLKGPPSPTILPATNIRLPAVSPRMIRSRTLSSGWSGPHESNTVVRPFFSVTCAASSIRSSYRPSCRTMNSIDDPRIRWTLASIRPGMMYLPAALICRASTGMLTFAFGPTATIFAPSITTTASGAWGRRRCRRSGTADDRELLGGVGDAALAIATTKTARAAPISFATAARVRCRGPRRRRARHG